MSRPLRVLQVTARFPPELGGIETHVAEVSRRLAVRPELDVTVLTTSRARDFAPSSRTAEGVEVLRRRAWPAERDYYLAPGLARVIRGGDWDVVHVQGAHTLVPPLAMAAALRAGVPYVVTFHTGGHSSAGRNAVRGLQWRVLAPLLRRAARLIAVGRFEQRMFTELTGVPAERFELIRNGGALPPPAVPVRPVPGRIVSVGRLERYKGHHRVLEALPHLLRIEPDAHVQILGAGPYEQPLRHLARELGVAERVSIDFLPPGDREAMARTVGAAGAMAAFSDYEAHPVAVMEALALDVPVLGHDVAGIGDLVEDGLVTGLSPDATPEQAAAALARVLRAPSRGGRIRLPTWEDAADRLATVYAEAAGRTRQPA